MYMEIRFSPLCMFFVWFGLVWWYINHCRLLNAEPDLFIYIRYIYMIYTHKSTKLNSSKFTNNSIKHQTFVYSQLNNQIIQFSISQS